MKNAITWFEIPAIDLDRACKFYETVLSIKFTVDAFNGRRMAIFPSDALGVGGALVVDSQMPPSRQGTLAYLDAGESLDGCVERIASAGGKVVMPKTDIGDPGFIAIFQDTEGNHVALHSHRAWARADPRPHLILSSLAPHESRVTGVRVPSKLSPTVLLRLLIVLAAFFVGVLGTRVAGAHSVGLSRGDYTTHADGLHADLTFSRSELSLGPDEVLRRISVSAGKDECAPTLEWAGPVEEDGYLVRGTYRCNAVPTSIDFRLFDALRPGHRHIARVVSEERTRDEILSAQTPSLALSRQPSAIQRPRGPFGAFVRMGMEHILFGYDHLLFLLGLVVVGGRPRALVGTVTAFTVAHSLTLALAVFGVWSPAPRFVEPAIALSIAYVGVENIVAPERGKRARLTFVFGLLHGFGFAGALSALGLPRAELPLALLGFNTGVELGQLVVVVPLFAGVLWASQRAWFRTYAIKATSAGIAAMGVLWFVVRVARGG